jgi:hypothetical protein
VRNSLVDQTANAFFCPIDTFDVSCNHLGRQGGGTYSPPHEVAAERREIESGSRLETLGEDGRPSRYHLGLGLGWVVPLGRVSSITDLVHFPEPIRARDLYEPCPELHLVAGLCAPPWMIECASRDFAGGHWQR